MSPTTFFFPTTHAHQSRQLQPDTQTTIPPSSFSRAGGKGLRNSLRRKASTVFLNSKTIDATVMGEKEKIPIDSVTGSKQNTAVDNSLPPPSPSFASDPPAKPKAKSRTRKALADLLHWGNSAKSKPKASAPAVTISAPQPLRSANVLLSTYESTTVQPKPPVITPPLIHIHNDPPPPVPKIPVKKSSSRRIQPKSSDSALSSLSSIQESNLSTHSRPSMGPDPFGRRDQGAEVVKQVTRHDVKLQRMPPRNSSLEIQGSDTVCKDKEHSGCKLDEPRTLDQAPIFTSMHCNSDSPQKRHVSAPLPSKAVLLDLPPRSVSLGAFVPQCPVSPVECASPPSVISPLEADEKGEVDEKNMARTMKREKTKSKVWGMLARGKSRRCKHLSDHTELEIQEVKDSTAESVKRGEGSAVTDFMPVEPRQAEIVAESALSAISTRPVRISVIPTHPPVGETGLEQPVDSSLVVHGLAPTAHPPLLNSSCGSSYVDVSPVSAFSGDRDAPSAAALIPDVPHLQRDYQQVQACKLPSKSIPKRKSLAGLFDLAMKKSFRYGDGSAIPSTAPPEPGAVSWGWEVEPDVQRRLRPLFAKTEDRQPVKPKLQESPPYRSRFGGNVNQFERNMVQGYADLRRVASATDKLSSLVSRFDFSPAPTPLRDDEVLRAQTSPSSFVAQCNGSPTPMRRVRSEMLSLKASTSPAKTSGTRISPLKFALHRAHAKGPTANLPPASKGLMSRGMRNVFAPPSPAHSPLQGLPTASPLLSTPIQNDAPRLSLGVVSAFKVSIADRMFDQTSTTECTRDDEPESAAGHLAADIPDDLLRAVISGSSLLSPSSTPPSYNRSAILGLPPLPPTGRITPRRGVRQPPAISLPPIPDTQLPPSPSDAREPSLAQYPSRLSVNNSSQDLVFNAMLAPNYGHDDRRESFDFAGEYAMLDRGDQRASFIQALRKAASNSMLTDEYERSAVLPNTASSESLHSSGLADSRSSEQDEHALIDNTMEGVEKLDESSSPCAVIGLRPSRPYPFMGQAAFQEYASRNKQHGRTISLSAPPCELAYQAPVPIRHRGHKRGESGLSIATMSSIGAVIETGIAGEYTNHFEVNFAEHLRRASVATTDSADEASDICPARSSCPSISDSSIIYPASLTCQEKRLSGQSETSVSDVELGIISGYTSARMASSRGASLMSRHMGSDSASSSLGRIAWADESRRSSTTSVGSNASSSLRTRPGLGEKMFHLDRNVQLESIAGSPSDEPVASTGKRDLRLDGFHILRNGAISPAMDSVFGSDTSMCDSELVTKGKRPMSAISSASSSDDPDDTFIEIAKYAKRFTSPSKQSEVECLQGSGEDVFTMSPTPSNSANDISSRQLLGSSISRPSKPQSAHRHRPAHLVFKHPSTSTPGLTSPSASETSSRVSLDTRISDPFSVVSGRDAGHHRHKSSAGVQLQATIREEPSFATIRPDKRSLGLGDEPEIARWDGEERDEEVLGGTKALKSWIEWQREAGDECRRVKDEWHDSEESRNAVTDFKMPTTNQEITDFLTQSSETFKPLDQLPIGRLVHRRKSSLSDVRLYTSPYGLPLPRLSKTNQPRISLITKFQRTNSSTSSNMSFPGEDPPISAPPTPLSAVFAEFTREHPASTPPRLVAFGLLSPSRLSREVAVELQNRENEAEEEEKAGDKRGRISPEARRQALGWGRRRNSDEPFKTQKLAQKPEVFPYAEKAQNKALPSSKTGKDKENVPTMAPSNRKRTKSAHHRTVNKRPQVQARGLRA